MNEVLMDDVVAALLHNDPRLAVQVLSNFLEEGNHGAVLEALHEMTKAFGGSQNFAGQVGLSPRQLERTLSSDGDPSVNEFAAILEAMGMQLRVSRLR